MLLTFATPLGLPDRVAPFRTALSLAMFRAQVDEFHRVWTMRYELDLAIATGLPAAWALADAADAVAVRLGLWLLSLALLISAVRGLMFFGVVSVAVFQRGVLRARAAGEACCRRSARRPALLARRRPRGDVIGGRTAVYYRWVNPPLTLGGTRPASGRHGRLGRGRHGLHPARAAARTHAEPRAWASATT